MIEVDIYDTTTVEMDEDEYMRLSKKLRRWLEKESFFFLDDELNFGIDDENKHDLEFWDQVCFEIAEKGYLRLVVKKKGNKRNERVKTRNHKE